MIYQSDEWTDLGKPLNNGTGTAVQEYILHQVDNSDALSMYQKGRNVTCPFIKILNINTCYLYSSFKESIQFYTVQKNLIKLMFGNIPYKMYTNQDIYIGIIVHYFSFQLIREWCDWNHRFHILPHCCSSTGTNRINEPSINNHW